MHGEWSLDIHWECASTESVANFSADMTMSDYGATVGVIDPTKAGQPSHAPHQTDERNGHLEHGRLPRRQPRHADGLSDKRHGQLADGKWKHRPVRDRSAFIDSTGLVSPEETMSRTRWFIRMCR